MRAYHVSSLMLALLLCSCASWHHPSRLFREQQHTSRKPPAVNLSAPEADEFPRPADRNSASPMDAHPAESASPDLPATDDQPAQGPRLMRRKTNGQSITAEDTTIGPPATGYVELPPPPE